jgi:hypothetical protein
MALTTVSSDRLSTNVKASNLNSEFGQLGNRRLNINGAMAVAQRGTVSGITSSTYAGPDRFRFGIASHGTFTVSQDSSAPTGSGFLNSLKLACTTADTSVAADAVGYFQHKFEGQDCQQIKKGTSSAEQLAVQFWVKSNKTGNYAFQVKDEDNIRSFTTTYTISSADTWEKKTIIIPADTTGALDDDINASLTFHFWLVAGSNSTSGSASTSWYGNVPANLAVGHNVNIADSTSNTWYMTGFQVEIGSVHTDFEHRSFTQEIALCQRYCYVINMDLGDYSGFQGQALSDVNAQVINYFPTPMRTEPTYTGSATLCRFQSQNSSVSVNFNALSIHRTPQQRPVSVIGLQDDDVGSMSGGQSVLLMAMADSGKMTFEAEL